MRAQVDSSTIANICWLIQTFEYLCCGFQAHFKSIWVYNLKTKSDFWSKRPHYIMGFLEKWALCFSYFHWFWIWHISVIHCVTFEVHTCNICDVVTIPINVCSLLFNRLNCAKLFLVSVALVFIRNRFYLFMLEKFTTRVLFIQLNLLFTFIR